MSVSDLALMMIASDFRSQLDESELDLLLETQLQCIPVDTIGRRRLPRTIFHANALLRELHRRRDHLRAARAEAAQMLVRATTGEGSSSTRELCAALAAGRAAALEGHAATDGIGPLGSTKGRWMVAPMHEAYLALMSRLCDDRSPAARSAVLRRLASVSPRTSSLGYDRWGRRHWVCTMRLTSRHSALSCAWPPTRT